MLQSLKSLLLITACSIKEFLEDDQKGKILKYMNLLLNNYDYKPLTVYTTTYTLL